MEWGWQMKLNVLVHGRTESNDGVAEYTTIAQAVQPGETVEQLAERLLTYRSHIQYCDKIEIRAVFEPKEA